ncbi:transporter, partial [Acinetobacter baumannii]
MSFSAPAQNSRKEMNSTVLSLFPLVALIASGYLFKKYRFFSD